MSQTTSTTTTTSNTEGDIQTMNNNSEDKSDVKPDVVSDSTVVADSTVTDAPSTVDSHDVPIQNGGRTMEEMESDAKQLIQKHADMVAAAKVKEQEQRLAYKKLEDIKMKLEMLKMGYSGGGSGIGSQPKTEEEAIGKKYNFWETQPVQKLNETAQTNESIEPDKPKEEIRQEPLKLPDGFVWICIDIDSDSDLKELYTLLYENYVEDDDNMFRFNYLPEFLRWVLKPPGWNANWFVGVRVAKTPQQLASGKQGKLVGFISAIPAKIRVYDKTIDTVEINFLCVHKKLRSKRMTPVLISEITRRVNLCGLFQAVYTAGVYLPKPISTCRYYHRSLNPRKLIDVGFSILSRNMTMSRTVKFYRLPEQPKLSNLRQFEKKDIGQVHRLLTEHMKKFDLVPCYEQDELLHWLTPIPNVVETYVAEAVVGEEKKKQIVGFFSFYILPSTVMNHKTYKDVKAAYSFYNVPSDQAPLVDLMHDALVIAKNSGLDVFNALNQMQNGEYLDKLKFGSGDGNLHYYLFNWKCPSLTPDKVGIVLQ